MDPATEIRKLSPSNTQKLVDKLEYNGQWEHLMEIIPKQLERDNFHCDVTSDNLPKYHSDHFRLIKNASNNNRRCSDILLDEWGTSGRVRPTLGHLLHLLKRARLFGAADLVASFLGIDPPERPRDGPAARVRFTSDEDVVLNRREIDSILDNISYDSSGIVANLNGYSGMNKVNAGGSVPKIVVVTTGQDRELNGQGNSEIASNGYTNENNEEMIPHITLLLNRSSVDEEYIPQVSALIGAMNSDTPLTSEMENNIPHFSDLLVDNTPAIIGSQSEDVSTSQSENISTSQSENISTSSQSEIISTPNQSRDVSMSNNGEPLALLISNDNNVSACEEDPYIPPISALLQLETSEQINSEPSLVPAMSSFLQNSTEDNLSNIPPILVQQQTVLSPAPETFTLAQLGLLQVPNSAISTNSEVPSSVALGFQHSPTNSSTSSRPQCHSPLPNLSLNTNLPHFMYQELEVATNNFDETPLGPRNEGRFLGSGAFASVYLAIGLLAKPTAIKKLYLNGVSVVNLEDSITKQFRNEVEILSKYKHDNLLSICGYSCDGPTYCLIYDYISGGALNCRLENNKEKLPWEERLKIACGTAEAAAYLHTAFSTPVIHRDIKTANILLDPTNVPKLGDFGIIKFSPNQHTTMTTTIIGTSVYMAPEIFRSGDDYSELIDTYSFGVVVLELLTALPPLDQSRECTDIISYVEEKCDTDSIDPILDRSAGIWSKNDVSVAEDLFTIANRCLKEKKHRPTMVDVRDQLRRLKTRVGI